MTTTLMQTPLAQRLSSLAIAITVTLQLELLAWQLASSGSAWRWLGTALLLVPAACMLRSLLRHRPNARAWTVLGAIPYVTVGVMELIANPQARVWAAACAVLAFIQFVVIASLLRATRNK